MKALGNGNHVTNKDHYPRYKYFDLNLSEYRSKYQDKMQSIGNNASKLFTDLLKCQPYSWNKIVQGVISLQKTYTASIVDLACKRALVFGITSYSKIKSICKTGSYALLLDELHIKFTKTGKREGERL